MVSKETNKKHCGIFKAHTASTLVSQEACKQRCDISRKMITALWHLKIFLPTPWYPKKLERTHGQWYLKKHLGDVLTNQPTHMIENKDRGEPRASTLSVTALRLICNDYQTAQENRPL